MDEWGPIPRNAHPVDREWVKLLIDATSNDSVFWWKPFPQGYCLCGIEDSHKSFVDIYFDGSSMSVSPSLHYNDSNPSNHWYWYDPYNDYFPLLFAAIEEQDGRGNVKHGL